MMKRMNKISHQVCLCSNQPKLYSNKINLYSPPTNTSEAKFFTFNGIIQASNRAEQVHESKKDKIRGGLFIS